MAHRAPLLAVLCVFVFTTIVTAQGPSNKKEPAGAFRALARDDFQRSIEVAKSFTGESPRSLAILAVARAILEKKPASTAQLN